MPRFADDPRRPPPSLPDEPVVAIELDAERLRAIPVEELVNSDEAEDVVADFHCVTTWSVVGVRWRGVRLADLVAAAAGARPIPAHAAVRSADGLRAVYRSEDLLDERSLLATHRNGAPLDIHHGAPLRLVAPHLYGYKNIKHVTTVELLSEEPEGSLGAKEHRRARVAYEERHAKLPAWLVRWPYRLVVPPTILMAERSWRHLERPGAG